MEVAGSLLLQQCQQSLPVLTLCHHSPSHGKCMLARAKARGEIRHYRASKIHNLLWQKRTHFSLSSPFEKGIISGQARFFLCMRKKPGPTTLVLRSCITSVCWCESRWATARSYMACPAGTTTRENLRINKKGIELIPKDRDCTTTPSISLHECLQQILTLLPAPFLAQGSCTLHSQCPKLD